MGPMWPLGSMALRGSPKQAVRCGQIVEERWGRGSGDAVELSIEAFLPADEATAQALRS